MIKKLTLQVRLGTSFRVACAVLGIVFVSSGAPLTEREALDRLSIWINGHPVMGCLAGNAIASTVRFQEGGGSYSVYAVAFSPVGYVVLNSDDRLPLVVAFSASSGVNLADLPDNAFRAALLTHVANAAETLGGMDTALAPDLSYRRAAPRRTPLSIEQYGPYLATTWNQCNPYNLLCPEDPGGSAYYGYRAPTGCTPAAYAQVLYYHRWPLRGQGSHSYTDSSGSITGTHSVCFSTPFGWAAMQAAYDPWTTAPQLGDVEVADLMYRLGVAADADYESDGTASSIRTLGERLNTYLFYEPIGYASSQTALLPGLNESLRTGYPCVVAVPGHAIAADGLLDDNGTVSYHINYGWGGSNDGWWSADNVAGKALAYGCTSLKPMLMAFPAEATAQAAAGEPVTLEWLLPVRREQEAGRILIRRLMPQSGTWSSAAETLDHTVSSGWQLKSGGRTGSCWFTGPNGYSALTLTDIFVPDASATLAFWMKYRLGTATFRVAVSSDGGDTYTTLFERNNNYPLSWQSYTVGLGAYAGKEVRIRFELTSGSYYQDTGGVWLDDLGVTSGTWQRWMPFAEDTTLARLEGQPVHFTVLTPPLEIGSYTLASVVEDTNTTCHALSPAFTLNVLPRFNYRLEPGGGVTLTRYNGNSARLEIPAIWEGQPVTGIASNAFDGTPVFSVILPTSITAFESDAFAGADALQRLFFTGDAPSVAANALADSAATVYYLPGKNGWSASLGGRPALLWNPAPVPGAGFGFQNGVFGFTLSGTALIPVHVQAAADLTSAVWYTITNTAIDAAGTLHVRDPESPAHTERFYRIVWP
ncbi:MAG TPA: C10 family peptidase [Kiritimatiellia bacterium]|jgi:hypothetical protein|nr:C10 family peptidase [Kiritimatiellia bacterium]